MRSGELVAVDRVTTHQPPQGLATWMDQHRGTRRAARSLFGIVLFLPALLAMESTPSGPDDVWKYIAMAAMGGLVTAFALGRNAVTRQDLVLFETKMTGAMEKQSPWAAVVEHRLDEGEKRMDEFDKRVHRIAEDGQIALGLKEFVLDAIKSNRSIGDRLAKVERGNLA